MPTFPFGKTCKRALAGLLLLSAAAGFAQPNSSGWLVRSWQTDDGLPYNSVNAVAQAADGFLWIGMPSGLARFDGIHFEQFPLTNLVASPNRGVINILRGRSGDLWLTMDRGEILRLNGKASRAFIQELPKDIPGSLVEDAGGNIWISYLNGAIFRLKEDRITAFTSESGFPAGPELCALATDKRGVLWFAKNGQVGQFRADTFQKLFQLEARPTHLAAAANGGVWICAGTHLYKSDANGGLQDFGSFQTNRNNTDVWVMLEDRQGAVWLGTAYSGLYRHDAAGFSSVPTTHQGILSLHEDKEGNIWVGTSGGGLDCISPKNITLQGVESGLPFPAVQSICEDSSSTLWATIQNGDLVHLINDRWQTIPLSPEWPGGATSISADGQGTVWIGSRRGLYCWRDGHFVNWNAPAAIQDKIFHSVLVSRAGDIWLGQQSPSAILRLRDGELKTFPVPPDSRIIRAMTEDAAGSIWAGTSKGTLFRVSGDAVTEETPRHTNDLAPIRCLCATTNGAVWIGYAGYGVGYLKAGQYIEFNQANGLYDNYISEIIADADGWLWFGGNRGIFKARKQAFQALIAGRAARIRSIKYGHSEGLPNLQAPYGDSPNVLRSRDGRLWFPMETALAVVSPDRLNKKLEPPPALLARVTVDDQMMAQYRGILPSPTPDDGVADLATDRVKLELPPGHRRLEFEFAALSFYAPGNIQFRYRLRGLDDNWVEAGSRRNATYSRLPNGHYVFEVAACNSDGDWNATSASFSLVVNPFYWQTWWFRLGLLLAFSAGIIATVRYVSFRRLQQQLRILQQQAALQKERARIAKDIHDDLGASLTQIAYLGELAHLNRNEPEKVEERISNMSTTARQAVKSLDEIVWAVNPRNDTLAHLIDYLNQFAFGYLRLAGIRVRLDFPEMIPQCELSADLRHNIFLTVKEALHNVVKHARATEVRLNASVTELSLEIGVEDNGCGFSGKPDDALADGLRNMRQRMSDIGGECRVESQSGSGTKVTLRLPWPELNKK